MSELDAYLQAFDDTWSHDWESIQTVLKGVSDDAAFWQAPAYAGEAREEGWPAPGTIAWHVAHIAHCKRYYAQILRRVGEAGRPEAAPWVEQSSFSDLLAVLRDAHADQRAAVAALADEQLALPTGNDMSLREFLAMSTRHDAWHAGQIAVARRLARGSA